MTASSLHVILVNASMQQAIPHDRIRLRHDHSFIGQSAELPENVLPLSNRKLHERGARATAVSHCLTGDWTARSATWRCTSCTETVDSENTKTTLLTTCPPCCRRSSPRPALSATQCEQLPKQHFHSMLELHSTPAEYRTKLSSIGFNLKRSL